MVGKENEMGNHSFRQRESTLAHFVDNSLTYDSFWTRFEVAERLRDFAFCATPSTRDSVQSSRDRLRHVFCAPDALARAKGKRGKGTRCVAELTDTFFFVFRHRDLLESFRIDVRNGNPALLHRVE